jgi:hypothetical protein
VNVVRRSLFRSVWTLGSLSCLSLLPLLPLSACNAVLGIDERSLRDAGAGDERVPAEASTPDSPTAQPSPYAQAVLADAPVVYLRFGERSGAAAVDQAHHVDGVYPAFGLTRGIEGALVGDTDTAVAFDGSSNVHVASGTDFGGLAAFSIELWVKRANAGASAFVVDHETYNPRQGWVLNLDGTQVGFERYSTGGNASMNAPVSLLPEQQWHHVLGTWDGQVSRLFVDGRLSGEGGATTIALPSSGDGFSIGGQNCACTGNHYVGALDELAIYDHVLTDERAKAHIVAAGR